MKQQPVQLVLAPLVALMLGFFLAGTAQVASANEIAPLVTNVNPAQGSRSGGTTVELTGERFTGANDVRFGNNGSASSFSVNSDTSITAVAPPQTSEAYVVGITVEGPGGESAQTPASRFIYGPIVESVQPSKGPAAGGATVTIAGLGLQGASEVDFGAYPAANFSLNPDGSITATAPPFTGGSASVPVRVTTPLGASNPPPNPTPGLLPSNYFVYGPTVTKIEPSEGPPVGGTLVIIRGTGFSSVRGGDEPAFVGPVVFGSSLLSCGIPPEPFGLPCAPKTFEVKSPTEITAVAPPGTGVVDIAVVTAGGLSPTTTADRFSYAASLSTAEERPARSNPSRACKKHRIKRHGKCVRTSGRHRRHPAPSKR